MDAVLSPQLFLQDKERHEIEEGGRKNKQFLVKVDYAYEGLGFIGLGFRGLEFRGLRV